MIVGHLPNILTSRKQGFWIFEHVKFSELQPVHWLHVQRMPSPQVPKSSLGPPQASSGPWKNINTKFLSDSQRFSTLSVTQHCLSQQTNDPITRLCALRYPAYIRHYNTILAFVAKVATSFAMWCYLLSYRRITGTCIVPNWIKRATYVYVLYHLY